MHFGKYILGTAAAMALSLGAGGALAQQTYEMKLVGATINDTNHEYLKEFERRIEAKTNGRIQATVYPAGQLGGISQMVEGVILGTIELYLVPPEFLSGINPAFGVVSAPGLLRDQDHAIATTQDPEFYNTFTNLASDQGILGASYYVYGPSAYIMKQKADTMADIKGKKIRVLASDVEQATVSKIGATGVPMPFGEVLAAITQGVLDGARTSYGGPAGGGWYESAPYVLEAGDSYVTIMSIVSKAWLATLPEDLQKAVTEVGIEMNEYNNAFAKKFLADMKVIWEKGGGTVKPLDPTEKAELLKTLAPIGDEVFKDGAAKDMYETLKSVAARH